MAIEQTSVETLRLWSQVLLWVSIILPVLAALAVGARYYIERTERSLSAQLTAAAIEQKSVEALRLWSQVLLWVSIILPVLATLAVGVRYYVERAERSLSAQQTAAEIQQAKEEAVTARSEISDAREKQQKAEAALRKSLQNIEDSAAKANRAAGAHAALKRTPPRVNAYMAVGARTGKVLIVMDTENLVPFRAHWDIVTEKDRIVAGFMIEDLEIHPAKDRKRFTVEAGINPEQVANEYVELRFRCVSIYSAEFGNPKELSVETVQRYRYKDGKVYPWETTER